MGNTLSIERTLISQEKLSIFAATPRPPKVVSSAHSYAHIRMLTVHIRVLSSMHAVGCSTVYCVLSSMHAVGCSTVYCVLSSMSAVGCSSVYQLLPVANYFVWGVARSTSPSTQIESFLHVSFCICQNATLSRATLSSSCQELLCQADVHPINGPIEKAKVNPSVHLLQEVAGTP